MLACFWHSYSSQYYSFVTQRYAYLFLFLGLTQITCFSGVNFMLE